MEYLAGYSLILFPCYHRPQPTELSYLSRLRLGYQIVDS